MVDREICTWVGIDLIFSHGFYKIHELINILGFFTKKKRYDVYTKAFLKNGWSINEQSEIYCILFWSSKAEKDNLFRTAG